MRLTPREREVAALVALGYTNREVAEALGISPATVAVHLRSILRELGVRSRAAVGLALLAEGELELAARDRRGEVFALARPRTAEEAFALARAWAEAAPPVLELRVAG